MTIMGSQKLFEKLCHFILDETPDSTNCCAGLGGEFLLDHEDVGKYAH